MEPVDAPVRRGAIEASLEAEVSDPAATVASVAPTSVERVSGAAVALTVLGCAQSFFSTGLLFGWPALALILKKNGQYRELCPIEHNDDTCPEQEERLTFIFTLGQLFVSTGVLCHGFILDRYGPRRDTLLALSMVLAGTVLMGVSDSKSFDAFAPAMVLLCFGGGGVHISLFNFSALFPLALRRTVASIITGAFVASGGVWLLWMQIIKAGGGLRDRRESDASTSFAFTRLHTFVYLHGGLLCCFFATSARLWPDQAFRPGVRLRVESIWRLKYSIVPPDTSEPTGVDKGSSSGSLQSPAPPPPAAPRGAEWPLCRQLSSSSFLTMLVFFAIHYVRYIWYIGTAVEQLEGLGDTTHAYVSWLPLTMALGCTAVPIVGLILERCGGVPSAMLVTNAFAVLYNAFAMADSLPLQPLAFVAASVFRVFLFSTMFCFLQVEFGHKSFGRLSGFMVFTASVFALSQMGSTYIVHKHLDNDFTPFNVAFLVCCAPLVLPPLRMRHLERKRQRATCM